MKHIKHTITSLVSFYVKISQNSHDNLLREIISNFYSMIYECKTSDMSMQKERYLFYID